MTKAITNPDNIKAEDEGANAPVVPKPVGRTINGAVNKATNRATISGGVKDAETSLTGNAAKTKETLSLEPKVSYIIPLGFGEKKGAYETVAINGYKLTIQKGVRVMIPESFALLLDDFLGIQNNIGLDKRLDLQDEKAQDALN